MLHWLPTTVWKNCLTKEKIKPHGYGVSIQNSSYLQKGSFLQGASFLDGNKIVVGLTARGKDADKFWFSLFHELAHIALGHVGQLNGTSEDDERTANKWSGDMLIASEDFETFRRNRDYSERNVLQFAKAQGIAPGIVVGRMQLEGMIQYSMLNHLKEKYEIAI